MSEPLGELTSRITSFTVQSNCCGLRNTSYAIGMQDGYEPCPCSRDSERGQIGGDRRVDPSLESEE